MRRSLLPSTAILSALLAALSCSRTPASAPAGTTQAAAGAAAPPHASVQVERQLVRARTVTTPVKERPAASRAQTPRARRAPVVKKESFLAKARRVLFGTGRHRPEPFPEEQR